MKFAHVLPLALLATLGQGLLAEETRYGLRAHADLPLGDLKTFVDSHRGLGFGIHETIDLLDGNMLRPRLDYTRFPEATLPAGRQSASSLSLGADYLYFFEGKPEHFYLTLGLAATRWSLGTKSASLDSTHDTTRVITAFGFGYQWSAALGTELRLTNSKVSSTFKGNTMQAGVTLRF